MSTRPRDLPLVDGVIDAIVSIGKRRAPREACGVILSDGRVVELPNVSVSPEDCYVMLGKDMEAVLIEPVGAGLEHVVHDEFVVWHTHPGGQVGPSGLDMELRVEGIQYLVVSWQDTPEGKTDVFPALYSREVKSDGQRDACVSG